MIVNISMEIEIPFTGWSRKKLETGTKSCTSRRYQMGEAGDTFSVEGVIYRVTRIEFLPLFQVRNLLFREEGADSPEQFERIFRSQHQFYEWNEGDRVYVHFFERTE
jgi:hypothetical protein